MSSEPAEVPWRGEPLPRGRHKLSAETVRASQRERLLRAMLESVAERGYAATTVPQVVAAARVSRNSFYALFADKTDCFLALLDQAADEMLDSLFALAAEPDWLAALRRGVRLYLRWWQDQPALSRAYFVELPVAGARAMGQRERAFARFEAMFAELARRARAEEADLEPVSPLAIRLVVVGITELVGGEVRAGRVGELVRLERELLAVIVRLLADDATARRVIGARRAATSGSI